VLANQWYTEKNRNLTPKDVTANSGKKVWWICKEGHVWCAAIYSRNIGSACPYCSGKKPDKRTCLKKINPLLAKEWHPMRNGSLTPKDVLPNSNKKVWWVCSRGHEWVAQINNRNKGRGCPECRSGTSQFELRVFCEMKHLFKQVHHRKKIFGVECDVYIPSIKVGIEIDSLYYHKGRYKQDVNKTNRLVKRGIRLIRIREAGLKPVSEDDILCDKDAPNFSLLSKLIKKIYAEAEADEHVKRRLEHYISQGRFANDKGYMDNLYKLPSPVDENSLAKCNKDLARQWHPTKNGSLTPRDVTPMSGLKIWWICDQGHEWDASVDKRSQGTGCPFCAGQKICDENSLFAVNPELAKEWHPTKNGSLTPDKTAPKARRTVWWVCSEGHEWAAAVYSRATGIGCPYCKGQRVCDDNSLMTINSKLAKEWHPTRNEGLTPRDVRPNSHKYVWWVCQEGHEWKAIIANRNKGKGCPFCSGKKSSSTNNLLVVNPTVANEWHPSKNGQLTPKDVTYGSTKKVWWMCTKGHEWQATVKHRNHGTGCPHCAGKMKGVTLSTSSLKI
jgi:very-short-patch-repair endonuclease